MGAAPLVAIIAALTGTTTIGLRRHRAWARVPFMFIWPLIVIFAIVEGLLGAITWFLA